MKEVHSPPSSFCSSIVVCGGGVVRWVGGAKRERCEEISLKGSAFWLVYCCGQKGGLLYKAGKKAAFYIKRAKRRPFCSSIVCSVSGGVVVRRVSRRPWGDIHVFPMKTSTFDEIINFGSQTLLWFCLYGCLHVDIFWHESILRPPRPMGWLWLVGSLKL